MYNNNQNQNQKFNGETFAPKTTTNSVLTTTQNTGVWEKVKSFSTGKGAIMFGLGLAVGGLTAYALSKLFAKKDDKKENDSQNEDDDKE